MRKLQAACGIGCALVVLLCDAVEDVQQSAVNSASERRASIIRFLRTDEEGTESLRQIGQRLGAEAVSQFDVNVLTIDYSALFRKNLSTQIAELQVARDKRIIGGYPTTDYKEVVALLGFQAPSDAICTGTVLGRRTVITAAHCVCDGIDKFIRTGSSANGDGVPYLITSDSSKKYSFVIPQSCPSDRSAFIGRDIVILTLADPLPQSIPKAELASYEDYAAAAGKVLAVGFGLDDFNVSGTKRIVEIPIVSNECSGTTDIGPDSELFNCVSMFELVAKTPALSPLITAIDAGFIQPETTPRKGTCFGDSGGPMFIEVPETHHTSGSTKAKHLLVAITSRAVANAPCGGGTVGSLVPPRLSFINQQVKDFEK